MPTIADLAAHGTACDPVFDPAVSIYEDVCSLGVAVDDLQGRMTADGYVPTSNPVAREILNAVAPLTWEEKVELAETTTCPVILDALRGYGVDWVIARHGHVALETLRQLARFADDEIVREDAEERLAFRTGAW